ncbi:hypothetical protein [Nostoc sp.]
MNTLSFMLHGGLSLFATCLSGPKNLGLLVMSPPLWGLAGSNPAPASV